MKRLFILLLALSVMGCTSTGNEEKVVTRVWPNNIINNELLHWETFNGRIHRITEERSNAKDHFGDIIKTETFKTRIYSYDTDGRLIEICELYDGEIYTKRIWNYDDTGKLQSVCIYEENGTMRYKFQLEYNENGFLVRQSKYEDGELYGRALYECDDKGRIIKSIEYGRQGTQSDSESYRYDNNGNVIEITDSYGRVNKYKYDKNGNITTHERCFNTAHSDAFTYTYNDHGDVSNSQQNGYLPIEYRYEYDSHENPIKIITINPNNGDDGIYLSEYKIEYYE